MNKIPKRGLGYKSPMEICTSSKPDQSHVRIFGCATYAHTRNEKFDPWSTPCEFIGYQHPFGTEGFILWESGSAGIKILVRRDVIFLEECFPSKGEKSINQQGHVTAVNSQNLKFEMIEESDYQICQQGGQKVVKEDQLAREENTRKVEYETIIQYQLANYQLANDRERSGHSSQTQSLILMLDYYLVLWLPLLKCKGLNLILTRLP